MTEGARDKLHLNETGATSDAKIVLYIEKMTNTDRTNRLGVARVDYCATQVGLIFREQQTSDFGIDAQLELKNGATATGRLIAAQIKAGPSYFKSKANDGFWHYIKKRHKDLWLNHSLPVIIILCDLKSEVCYYGVVTPETCIPTKVGWRVLISKNKIIDSSCLSDFASIASPVAAKTDFSILKEEDVSHAAARRISLIIVAHTTTQALNKPKLGGIVRAALKIGQNSKYIRASASAYDIADRPVDVVYGYVYLREVDIESASWVCRFQWILPSLGVEGRPSEFSGKDEGNGLVIDWKDDSSIASAFDQRRVSKSEYLRLVSGLLNMLPKIEFELSAIIKSASERLEHSSIGSLSESFHNKWNHQIAAPLECQRLHRAIIDLLAIVGNIGLVSEDSDTWKWDQALILLRSYERELIGKNRDISFLIREVE